MGGPVRDQLANTLAVLERRVFSLERRFRDFAARSVKYLYQLLDVRITYEGPAAVADGDVLTYDADLERWINAAPGGDGNYASLSYNGWWDGADVLYDDTEWAEWSHADYELGLVTVPTVGLGVGIGVTQPGLYRVWASAQVTSGTGTPTVSIIHHMTAGWTTAGDANTCRDPLVTLDDAAEGGAASIMLPLHPDFAAVIDVDLGGATEVRWRLQVEWAQPLAVEPGTCGG